MGTHRPRALTSAERGVLDCLLSADFPGVSELRDQAGGVRVVGECDCGCPSISLAVRPGGPAAPIRDGLVPVELRATPVSEEPEGDVILFVKDGRLSYLEYVYYTDRPPLAWPTPDRLRLFPENL